MAPITAWMLAVAKIAAGCVTPWPPPRWAFSVAPCKANIALGPLVNAKHAIVPALPSKKKESAHKFGRP
jgi:hypothetical protein